ncbi:MAG: hypothetical protein ACOX19_12490 [Fermentimonas sp.]|jgi:hypothetical protein
MKILSVKVVFIKLLKKTPILLLAFLLQGLLIIGAELKLPSILGSHMLLQREMNLTNLNIDVKTDFSTIAISILT